MKPFYEPKGRAKEYGDMALNIYTGCNHGCTYCFAPLTLKRDREKFHADVAPRKNIVSDVKQRLDKGEITGKLIHLCFACDPYPANIDMTPTRDIIKAIKEAGNNVQILTKGGARAMRDFDLLDGKDWFGVTIGGTQQTLNTTGAEPNAAPIAERINSLKTAHKQGIKTWVSCEPALDTAATFALIQTGDYIDHIKIGKLNYMPSSIDWRQFGLDCERLCRQYGRDYYIKEDLRKLMGGLNDV